MKQLCLSAIIELDDDLFASSEVIRSVREPWSRMLAVLSDSGVPFKHSQEIMDIRTKAKRAPRKPKLVMTPPEAA
jgi:hypothetical protein